MDKQTTKNQKSTTSQPNTMSSLILLATAAAIGGLAYWSLFANIPFKPLIQFDDTSPEVVVLYIFPAIAQILMALLFLTGVAYKLRQRNSALSMLTLYWTPSILILAAGSWFIYQPAARIDWTLSLSPQKDLSNSIAETIRTSADSGDPRICDLLIPSEKKIYLNGVTAHGKPFTTRPSPSATLVALNGKTPGMCLQSNLFETAKTVSDYYSDLAWFPRECNTPSITEQCDIALKNLVRYHAPATPVWHQGRFYQAGKSYRLEYLANPGKGMLLVKSIPVKDNRIRIDDVKEYEETAKKVTRYSIYRFNCTERKYVNVTDSWESSGANQTQNALKVDALRLNPIPPDDETLTSYLKLACDSE